MFQRSIGSTSHRFFSTCRFPLRNIVEPDEYIIFFLRNTGSEKERVAEEMPISEVRKCSRLLTPVNSLIDYVVGTC